ncbi:MAG: diguanylate cyclase [Elusimicrobia bacterium]|nr:diguanylate cyclase [Elusimicrobiota bacterium]
MAISAKAPWPVPKATPHPLVYLSTHYIQAKEYLEAIVGATSDAICTTDMAGRVIFFSPGAERMTGLRSREIVGLPAHLLYEGGVEEANRIMRSLIDRGRIENYETVLSVRGRRVPISMSAALLKDRSGNWIGTLGISKDITQRVELERRLREMSITDELTGLYNQRHLQEKLAQELQRAKRQRGRLSILLMDMDGFKRVNDSRGHVAGDRLLRRTAAVIAQSIRGGVDAAFRYGGDEFIVLLPGLGLRKAEIVAQRIGVALAADETTRDASLSCGAAALRPGDSPGSLLRRADEAMYRVKRRKKDFDF